MFAERFDALMNIAEVSNSLLGRSINMNPSHIGRLRKGVRALAKKHDYLPAICTYLTKHIEKDCPSKQEELYKSLKNRVLRIPDFHHQKLKRISTPFSLERKILSIISIAS